LSDKLVTITTKVDFPNTYLRYTLEFISKLIVTKDLYAVDTDTFYIKISSKYTFSNRS